MRLKKKIYSKERIIPNSRFNTVFFSIFTIISMFFLVFSLQVFSYENNHDPYPDIVIPVYKNGKDVKKSVDSLSKIKSISYTSRIKYPATELIEFYDKAMRKYNFTHFLDINIPNGWIDFKDQSTGKIENVLQYSKAYIGENKKKKAILMLKNSNYFNEKKSDTFTVILQISPFYDPKELKNFTEKLKREGKFNDLMELLKGYLKKSGQVDFKQAIRDNPHNEELRIYSEIISEISNN